MPDTPASRNQGSHIGAHEGDSPAADESAAASGLKVWADIGLKVGKAADEQAQSAKRIAKAMQTNTPVFYSKVASGTCVNSTTPLLLSMGSPDSGTYWEAASVIVGGADYVTAAPGTAGLYVVAYANAALAELSNLADFAPSLPNVGFYGTRQLIVNDQESLVVVIRGGQAGQLYICNAQLSVFTTSAAMGRTETIS